MAVAVAAWRTYEAEPDHIPFDGYYYAPIEIWAPIILAEVERRRSAEVPQLYLLPSRRVSRETSDAPALSLVPASSRPLPGHLRRLLARRTLAEGMGIVEQVFQTFGDEFGIEERRAYAEWLAGLLDEKI